MRISQLARKLELTPTQLIRFFNDHDIGHYTSHNNKVTDEDEAYAIQKLKPEFYTNEESKGDLKYSNEEIADKSEIISNESIESNNKAEAKEIDTASLTLPEQSGKGAKEDKNEIEVIRA